MKRTLALILSALISVSLVSCGSNKTKDTTADSTASTSVADSAAPDTEQNSTVPLEKIARALAAKYAEYADLRSSYDEQMKEMDEARFDDWVLQY